MKTFSFLIMMILIGPLYSPSAQACACCAEIGDDITRPYDFFPAEQAKLKFKTGEFGQIQTEAGLNSVSANGKDYSIIADNQIDFIKYQDESYEFKIVNKKNPKQVTTISFATTSDGSLQSMHIDRYYTSEDKKVTPSSSPLLYHKLTFQGRVGVTGYLEKFIGKEISNASLILRGHGNHCVEASHFETWSLELTNHLIHHNGNELTIDDFHFIGNGYLSSFKTEHFGHSDKLPIKK